MATVAAAPASHFEILFIQTLHEIKCKSDAQPGSGLGVCDLLILYVPYSPSNRPQPEAMFLIFAVESW
jgi:hypothetical protein